MLHCIPEANVDNALLCSLQIS